MIEGCPGVDMKMLTDLPYRRGITSLFDKGSDEIEDLSLPGCQLHSHLLMKVLYICLVVKEILTNILS
jgi:hypothetical protein